MKYVPSNRGTWWCIWLRHRATSPKIAVSIPDGVIGIFHWHNPSGRTMYLGLTQPLTEMKTRNISLGGKGGRCVRLTTLPHSCADCLEIWEPQHPGTFRACPGLHRDCFTFTIYVPSNAATHPRRTKSSITPLWKLKTRKFTLVFLFLYPCVMSYCFLHYQPWKNVISRRL